MDGRLGQYSRRQFASVSRTSFRVRNQLVLRHSSRSRPLKLSTCPFCIGLPGSMFNCERPHSSLDYRTPREFRQQLGCADVESKRRFPHPHSLGGGETVSTPKRNWETPVING
jgi:transposase InsO family protein